MTRTPTNIPKVIDRAKAYERAARYCATAERCNAQVLAKLRTWGAPSRDVQSILYDLTEAGFVDDERYAKAFTRDKHRFSGWGTRRIASELRAKGISSDIISTALTELTDECDTRDKLRTILEARLRSIPETLDRRRAWERLVRFGLYRGYDYEDVASIASSLLSI